VLGPVASGKSARAEDLLAAEPAVLYLATSTPPESLTETDPDWHRRIARHRERRPAWWRTLETAAVDILAGPGEAVLLDSLGGWATAALTRCGAWEDEAGWVRRWNGEVEAMVATWRGSVRRVVAVGEETGWGVVPATAAGRVFRDALGELTQVLAEHSERVELVVAGRVIEL
jgi:adenosylcobinamide kinase/adenosylcobinamide-phosphate guanylyltransferase